MTCTFANKAQTLFSDQRKSKVGEGKAKKKKSGKRKSKEPTSEQSPKPQKHYMQSNIEDEETLVPRQEY